MRRLQEKVGKLKKNAKGRTNCSKTISPATVNRELDVLSVIFNKAIVWGKLQVNPMKFSVNP